VAAATVGAAFVARYLISGTPKLPGIANGTLAFDQIWFVYFFPPVRLLEFLLGIFVAKIVMTGRWPRVGLLPAALFAVAGYVVSLFVPYLFGVGGVATFWVVPVIAAGARADWRGSWSPLRGRAMVWLGEVSFAFYMVHRMVIQEFHAALGATRSWSPLVGGVLIFAALVLSLFAAWLLYRFVETPMVRRFSRPRSGRPPRSAGGQPASPRPNAVNSSVLTRSPNSASTSWPKP